MWQTTFFASVATLCVLAAVHAMRRKPRDVSALPAPPDEGKALLRSGSKVAAIRACRRQSGASLLEAKRVIARHAARVAGVAALRFRPARRESACSPAGRCSP